MLEIILFIIATD